MGSIKSNTGEQIHCSPVYSKADNIIENTEKRRLELEPQINELANKISGDIIDTSNMSFRFIPGILHPKDLFVTDYIDWFYTGCHQYFYLRSIIFFV